MGFLTYEVEVDGKICFAHVNHLKPWLVESLPRSKPPSDDIPLDLISQTPLSDNNDNSMTAPFLVPATDEESVEQSHGNSHPNISEDHHID